MQLRLLIESQAREAGEERAYWDAVAERWMDLLREVVARRGLKEVAFALGVGEATLAHALEGRKRHAVHASWIPRLIAMAPDHGAVEFLAGLRGLECAAARPLSPEEEVAAWRAAVAELPAEMREWFQARVRSWRQRSTPTPERGG